MRKRAANNVSTASSLGRLDLAVRHVKRRRLTKLQAGRLMGLDQPKVSALMNGRLVGFSSGRLMRFLAALGQDVEIVIKARSRRRSPGQIRVVKAA